MAKLWIKVSLNFQTITSTTQPNVNDSPLTYDGEVLPELWKFPFFFDSMFDILYSSCSLGGGELEWLIFDFSVVETKVVPEGTSGSDLEAFLGEPLVGPDQAWSCTDMFGHTKTAQQPTYQWFYLKEADNQPPVAVDDPGDALGGFTTKSDEIFTTASVLANDTDPDGDTLSVVSFDDSLTKGNLIELGDGTFRYDPAGQFDDLGKGETATDTFVYTISDGKGETDTATVEITIIGEACTEETIEELRRKIAEIDDEIAKNTTKEVLYETQIDSLTTIQEDLTQTASKLLAFGALTSGLQAANAVARFSALPAAAVAQSVGEFIGSLANATSSGEVLDTTQTLTNTFSAVGSLLEEWADKVAENGPKAIGNIASGANKFVAGYQGLEDFQEILQRRTDLDATIKQYAELQLQLSLQERDFQDKLSKLRRETAELEQERFDIDQELTDCLFSTLTATHTDADLAATSLMTIPPYDAAAEDDWTLFDAMMQTHPEPDALIF